MDEGNNENVSGSGFSRWGRVYSGVALCTGVVIYALYLFSEHYSG